MTLSPDEDSDVDMPDMEDLDPDSDEDDEGILRGWRGQWEDSGDEGDDEEGSEDEEDMAGAPIRIARTIRRLIDSWYEHRYEAPRDNYPHGPASLPHTLNVLKDRRPDLFRRDLRVTPTVFDALTERIQDDTTFTNDSQNEQIPVTHQLAITLFRFGHSGNAASQARVAEWSGYSVGTVVHSTRRVMNALLRRDVVDETVCFPTDEEKEEAKRWVEDHSCAEWRDGFCMVDGTLVPIYERPFWFGESYFDRKSNYSLNIQVCLFILSHHLLFSCLRVILS